jgi:hypothetical protein
VPEEGVVAVQFEAFGKECGVLLPGGGSEDQSMQVFE